MLTQTRQFRLAAAVAGIGLVFAQLMPRPVAAQMPPPQPSPGAQDQQPAGDPPERVGRIARVSGTVSFHTRDDDRWNPATVNYPVTAGDAFWTEPNAQAEIEVSASRIVMAPGTELDIATLNDTSFQASQPQGETYLRVRAATPDETYAVQTPRGLATFAATGRYGVVAGDTQTPTTVTVIEGSAQISGPGLSMQVGPNQTATISGSETFQGDVGPAQRDPFLAAILERERPPPPQAVPPPPAVATMPGGEDLASYGSWSQSPQYGQVWYPQVAPDWVPYRDGRWDYVAPWGWTWVDSQPWGFAPFHYGRWVRSGGRWGWYPGAAPRPVYAPALVTFFGVGAAAGIGIGAALAGGRIGWCPLGPREAYHPWYRASDRYVRQVNIAHANFTTVNRNVTINNFVNRGAATVVPVSALTASRPVRPVVQRVDPAQFAQARPVFGQQPLRPTMATAGVTPAVARQLNLAGAPGAIVQRPMAPGPALRPAGLGPGAAGATRPFTGRPPVPTPGARPAPPVPGVAGPGPGQMPPAPRTGTPAPGVAGPPAGPPQTGPQRGQPNPAAMARPQVTTPAAPMAAPQAFHPIAPPPAVNAAPAPQPAAHPASPPQPQVVHPTPPAPVAHAAPPPPATVRAPPMPQVQSPPPPQMRVAAPPPPQQLHAPPPPAGHAPPPPAPVAHAPPPQHPQQQQRQKRPGEP